MYLEDTESFFLALLLKSFSSMKILIVDEETPYPLYTGKKLRTYNLLKTLQEKYQITFLCYGTRNNVPGLSNIKFLNLQNTIPEQKGMSFYFSLFNNIFSPYPYVVARHYSRLMEKTICRLIEKEHFDLVHCEWTPYTKVLRNVLPCPSVLSAHNVESQIWQRYFENEENILKKYYIYIQWRKFFRYEMKACALYTEIAAVSGSDKRLFEKWYGCKKVTVVPNGVDENFFSPRATEIKPYSMVFTGSMDWRPNQDAIKYFLEKIFPLIQKEIPAANLTIVGRNVPRWLMALADKYSGVAVTGTVEDVRPYMAESALCVVPIRIGGGSRLKILEALSMAKPVLSTRIGAEGLAVKDGEHLFLRDKPEDFAGMAIQMLNHPDRFGYLGHNGRDLVLARYTWDYAAGILDKLWHKAAQG